MVRSRGRRTRVKEDAVGTGMVRCWKRRKEGWGIVKRRKVGLRGGGNHYPGGKGGAAVRWEGNAFKLGWRRTRRPGEGRRGGSQRGGRGVQNWPGKFEVGLTRWGGFGGEKGEWDRKTRD